VTPLGNQSSSTMAHHNFWIGNNHVVMPSIYNEHMVQFASSLPVSHVYLSNSVNRSFDAAMPAFPRDDNMHRSYGSVDMPIMSNGKIYIPGHVSVMHNEFVPPYSSVLSTPHDVPQTYRPVNNHHGQSDVMTSANFVQPSYATPNSARIEVLPNTFSAPHDEPNAFYSASHDNYSLIDENSANMCIPSYSTVAYSTQPISPPQYISKPNQQVNGALNRLMAEPQEEPETLVDEICRRLLEQFRGPSHMKILRKVWEEEWIAEQGDGSDNVQSNDCISIFPNIGSASILGPVWFAV